MSDGELGRFDTGDDEGLRESELGREREAAQGENETALEESFEDSLRAVAKAQDSSNSGTKDSDDDNESSDNSSESSDEPVDDTAQDSTQDEDLSAPASWKAEAVAKWKDVPPEAKKEILRRETELRTNATKFAQLAHERQKQIEQLEQKKSEPEIPEEVKSYFSGAFEKGAQVSDLLVNYANVVEKTKTVPGVFSLLAEMAAMHKLTPVQLVDQFDAYVNGGGQFDLSQRIKAQQKQQSNPLEEDVKQIKQFIVQSQQEAQKTQAQAFIDQFRSEKDSSGQLRRPFFSEVEREVAQAVGVLRAQDPSLTLPELLEQAYQYAVQGNPTTRKKLEALRQRRESQQRQQRVSKANALAVSSPTGANGTARPVAKAGESFEDSLRAQAQELGLI